MEKNFNSIQHQKCEAECLMKFERFAVYYGKMFSAYRATEKGSRIDMVSLTDTGGTYCLEFKQRDKRSADYSCLFIEPSKFFYMRDIWHQLKYLPLYINFIGDDVYMWKINEINDFEYFPDIDVESDGEIKVVDRIGIMMDDAYIFKWNGECYDYRKPISKNYKTIDEEPAFNERTVLNNPIKSPYELCRKKELL